VLEALRYALHKRRCAACGQSGTAPLPEEAGDEQESPRARAVFVMSREYLGLPLYRLHGYQGLLGVPVPEATQWDQSEQVGDCRSGVLASREALAAHGELLSQDDTSVRMLALLDENCTRQAAAAARGLVRSQERPGM
jgi:hypothetical protein